MHLLTLTTGLLATLLAVQASPLEKRCVTAKTDLDGRASPKSSAARTSNVYKAGACINVKCQTTGDTLYGSSIWDYDGKYYLPDAYVKTGVDGFDPSIPRCGGDKPTPGGTGAQIVAKAQTQKGIQYSWGGGGNNGPTVGICCSPSGYDDRHRVGFDCSGLTKYAIYQIKKISLDHYTCSQYNDKRGKKIPSAQMQPGDLIFYGSDSQKCSAHVAIYAGNGQMVEAKDHGTPLGTHPVRSGHAPYVVRF